MAQVKKLQTGGRFVSNGKELSGQLALDRILDAANRQPADERAFFEAAARAVEDGMTAKYDPFDYSLVIEDAAGNDVSSRYISSPVTTKDSRLKKIFDATVENQRDKDRRSAVALSRIRMSTEPDKSEKVTLPELRRGEGWFSYTKDDDGNLKYNYSNPKNVLAEKILKEIQDYSTDENSRKRYATNKWSKDVLDNWLTAYGEIADKDAFWRDLLQGIKNGNITEDQKDWLSLLGFSEGTNGSASGSGNGGSKYKAPKGWKGDVSFLGPDNDLNVYIGDDGKMHIESSKYAGNWYLGGIKAFENTPYAFKIGDILYTGEEAERAGGPVGEILAPWYAASGYEDFGERYNARKGSGIRFVGDDLDAEKYPYGRMLRYDESVYNPMWEEYFASTAGPDYYSMYDLGTDKYKAIALPGEINPLTGWENLRYVVYNPETGKYTPYGSVDEMTSALGIAIPKRQRIFTPTHSDALDLDGQRYFTALELNSDLTGNNTILYNRADNSFYLARKSTKGLENPVKIKDQAMAKDLVLHPEKYSALKAYNNAQLWKYLVGSDWYDRWGKYLGWLVPAADVAYRETRKHQWGGIIDSQGLVNNISTAEAQADLSNSHEMFSKAGITGAEKKQIAAAALDLAGVVGAFIPELYTNIAAAGTGITASIMRSDAEKERTGKRNRGRLAADLALDATTLIPVLGGATKTAKAIDGILQVGEPIIKVLTAVGALNGADAMRRAMATGKLTTDDATSILQGLASAGVGVKTWQRSLGKSKSAAEGSTTAAAPKSKEYTEAKDLVIDKKATGIKKSAKDVDALISKHDGNSTKIIKEVKEELSNAGIKDVSDEAIKEGLHKINRFSTEGAKFRTKHPFETWKKSNRYEIWKQNPSEAPSTHGMWHYELMSMVPIYGVKHRANAIRSSLGNYTAQDVRAVINRFNSGERLTLAERELLNQTVMNPELFEQIRFSDRIGRSDSWKRHFSNMGVFYRENPKKVRVAKAKTTSAKANGTTDEVGAGIGYTPTGLNYNTGETFEYMPFDPTLILSDKKGGKIVKAQSGSNTRWWLDPSRENSFGIGSGELYGNTGSDKAKYSASNPGFLRRVYNLGTVAAILGGPNSIFGLLHDKLYKQGNNSTDTDANTTKPTAASSITTKSTPRDNGTKSTLVSTTTTPSVSSGSPAAGSASTDSGTPIATTSITNVPSEAVGVGTQVKGGNPETNGIIGALNPQQNPLQSTGIGSTLPFSQNQIGTKDYDAELLKLGIFRSPNRKWSYNPTTGKFEWSLSGAGTKGNKSDSGTGSGKGNNNGKGKPGGYNLAGLATDPVQLFDLTRAIWAGKDIWKDYINSLESVRRLSHQQITAPVLEQKRYNFSDILHGREAAVAPYLQLEHVTSDPRESMSFNLQRAGAISGINDKYNAALSKSVDLTDEANLATRNKQHEIDSEVANLRSKLYTGLSAQANDLNSQYLNALHTKVIDPYLAQISQDFKNIKEIRNQLQYQDSVDKLNEEYDTRIEALPEVAELRKAYNESEEKKNGMSFKSYIASDITRKETFDNAVKETNNWRGDRLKNLQLAIYKYPWLFGRKIDNNLWESPMFNKKGGKISKSTKGNMDPLAHIAVNLNRESLKSLQKERDNWNKRLMYLLSL